MTTKWISAIGRSAACAAAMTVAVFHPAAPALAQEGRYRFTIDERSSLAWWQISPHLDHLWATTCPQEPNWQPGSERSSGWAFDPSKAPTKGHAAMVDTSKVPLYPRLPGTAQPICTPAVRGEIVAVDTAGWKGVKGLVLIRSDVFITGLSMRDEYTRKAVLQSQQYPDIRFTLDSLTDLQRGDTLRANAWGVFWLRGVTAPMKVPVKAWKEAGGLRVTGRFNIVATDLVEKYKISRFVLGLGVGTGIWKIIHLGFDVVLDNARQT